MQILSEVADTLSALLADRGPEDPTFQRMVSVYRDVTELLGCREPYEQLVSGLLAAAPHSACAAVREQS